MTLRFKLISIIFITLLITLILTFSLAYQRAKLGVLNATGETFKSVVKDALGFIEAMDEQVKQGHMTLEQAQETVRTYLDGPKTTDGTRDLSKSKASVQFNMYVWAFSPTGILTMHPLAEGANVWDLQVRGRYTVRDTWANPGKTGTVLYEIWQNPNEPVTTWQAYLEYYKPWNWVIGTGARTEMLYAERLKSMKNTFIILSIVSLIIAFLITYIFGTIMARRLDRINDAVRKASEGDLTFDKLHDGANDEIGKISNSVQRMVENLRSLIFQSRDLSDQVLNSSGKLDVSTRELAMSIDHVASATDSIASSAEKQVFHTIHASKVMENMAKSMQEIYRATQDIKSNGSLQTGSATEYGLRSVEKSQDRMNLIQNKVTYTASVISSLGRRSEEISKIMGVIKGISSQTSLLSLNAAIEAARAGEHGRGFAVVASEVRHLADQATASTKFIVEIIHAIQAEIDDVQNAMLEVVESVRTGTEIINNNEATFAEIGVIVKEMIKHVDMIKSPIESIEHESRLARDSVADIENISNQVFEGMETLVAYTEEQNVSVQEINQMTERLAKMAENLNKSISNFKI